MSAHVRVVGTGLIGTSLGIALSRKGFDGHPLRPVADGRAPGARPRRGGARDGRRPGPDLVVVAAPPDVAAAVVLDALARWPDAVVTDVASVKGAVLAGASRPGAAT